MSKIRALAHEAAYFTQLRMVWRDFAAGMRCILASLRVTCDYVAIVHQLTQPPCRNYSLSSNFLPL
jgi:hypothetical protein